MRNKIKCGWCGKEALWRMDIVGLKTFLYQKPHYDITLCTKHKDSVLKNIVNNKEEFRTAVVRLPPQPKGSGSLAVA